MSWEKVSFTQGVRDITGGNAKFQSNEYLPDGNTPIVDQGNGLIGGYTNSNEIVKRKKDVIVFGDHTKALKYIDFDFCLGADGVKVLEPIDDLDTKFLLYYLQTVKLPNVGYSRHFKFLKEIEIPLPPLPIQKQIAEILDKADALRRKDQLLLDKYDELAQAIFIDMFGDPVKNEKGWEVKKLGEICNKITDGTHFSPPNTEKGIPYVTAKHLKKDVIDFYSNATYVSLEYHKEIYSRCAPKKGDVLYIKDGATTGVAAVNEYDFEFSMLSSLALIKPDKELLNSYFLSTYLNHENVKDKLIREFMAGAAIKRFTLDKIKRFDIIVPPIEKQERYEMVWKRIFSSTYLLKTNESNSLFQTLLQKAFKGELTTGEAYA